MTPPPEPITETLDCWDGCDGPAPHETTADGLIRRHCCLVCGHVWASVAHTLEELPNGH